MANLASIMLKVSKEGKNGYFTSQSMICMFTEFPTYAEIESAPI